MNEFSDKSLLISLILISLAACTGERGPAGPAGPSGPEVLPISFEFEVDLLEEDGFEFCSDIPGQIEVYESDVMLAYVLEDFIEDEDLGVWRQLPVTEFNDRGTLLFDFDFTAVDVCIFLDANYPLEPDDEFEQVLIRAVHVPAVLVSQNMSASIKDSHYLWELESLLEMDIQGVK
ncbi:MAG: hypothetical protein WDZ53_08250 [Balneolales bacterium]